MIEHNNEHIDSITKNQQDDTHTIKRIKFNNETLKNLKTIIYHENLGSNRRSEELLSETINTLANEYIKKYFAENFKI